MANSSASNPDVRVVLGGDSSPLTKATAEAQRVVARMRAQTTTELREIERAFQTRMGGAGRAVGQLQTGLGGMTRALTTARNLLGAFGIAAGAGGLVAFGRHVFDTVANLGKMAEQMGVTTEAFQVYGFIADQTNVKQENLQTGFNSFNRIVGQAAEGNDAAIASFRRLGVGILDAEGKLRPTERILEDVARALMGIEDPALRALAAQKLFGGEGSKLLPFLAELAKGLDTNAAAAKRMGAVIGDDVIVRFNKLSNAMARSAKAGTVWIAEVLDKGIGRLETFVGWLRLIPDMLARIPGMGSGGLVDIRPDVTFPDFQESGFWPPVPSAAAPAAAPRLPESASEVAAARAEAFKFLQQEENLAKEMDLLDARGRMADAKRNRSLDDYIAGLDEAARLENLVGVEKEKAQAILAATKQLTDEHGNQLRELTALERERIAAALETRETILRQREGLQQLAGLAESAFDRAGQAITNSLTQGAFDWRKTMLDVVSEVFQAMLKLAAFNPLLNMLDGGNRSTLGSLFKAGLGFFGGASWTNAAGGTTPANHDMGFAGGGSFTVGGSGGTDSKLVRFRATPGERVTIETPAQQSARAPAMVAAPRLHGGLAPDEFAAVLQKGDAVFTRGQQRALGGMIGRGTHVTAYLDGGTSPEAIAELFKMVRSLDATFDRRAVGAVVKARQDQPRIFASGGGR